MFYESKSTSFVSLFNLLAVSFRYECQGRLMATTLSLWLLNSDLRKRYPVWRIQHLSRCKQRKARLTKLNEEKIVQLKNAEKHVLFKQVLVYIRFTSWYDFCHFFSKSSVRGWTRTVVFFACLTWNASRAFWRFCLFVILLLSKHFTVFLLLL